MQRGSAALTAGKPTFISCCYTESQTAEHACTEPLLPTHSTYRMMISMHVRHKHSYYVTQHLVNLVSIVATELSKRSFSTV